MASIRIEGLKELGDTLNQMSERLRKKVLRDVLTEAAEPMRAMASRLAPRDEGHLRERIVVRGTTTAASEMDGMISFGRNDEYQASVAMGPTRAAFYGGFQEFGTVRHGAQPFMRPAFDAEAQKALRGIGEMLWRELAGRGIHRPTQVAPSVPSGPGSRLT